MGVLLVVARKPRMSEGASWGKVYQNIHKRGCPLYVVSEEPIEAESGVWSWLLTWVSFICLYPGSAILRKYARVLSTPISFPFDWALAAISRMVRWRINVGVLYMSANPCHCFTNLSLCNASFDFEAAHIHGESLPSRNFTCTWGGGWSSTYITTRLLSKRCSVLMLGFSLVQLLL